MCISWRKNYQKALTIKKRQPPASIIRLGIMRRIIYLLHPDKWAEINQFWAEKDESFLETVIVHELLHLHFSHHHSIKKSWKIEREELAINQLTNAFMCLDGQINQPENHLKDHRRHGRSVMAHRYARIEPIADFAKGVNQAPAFDA